MTPYVYCILLITMLLLLYWSGTKLRHDYKILSVPGIVAILAFTLNEGLRFGRGIDYNLYWRGYMNMEKGLVPNFEIGFWALEKSLIELNQPWQTCVIIMSFMFIFSTLLFLKNYRRVIMFVLPLWVFFTKDTVENLMRWNLAFSFVLIGLSFQISERKKINYKFWLFSLLGCAFHFAIFPIPIVFYFLWYRDKPILNPFYAIGFFIAISLLFEIKFMLEFANYLDNLTFIGQRFQHYIDNSEYWLTKSAGGISESAWLGGYETILSLFLSLAGYVCCREMGKNYVLAYNLFTIGVILRPMTRQIEIINRYDNLFYYFRAVVFASIIYMILKNKVFLYHKIISPFVYLFIAISLIAPIRKIFNINPQKLLYVWDSKGKTPESQLEMYNSEKDKINN